MNLARICCEKLFSCHDHDLIISRATSVHGLYLAIVCIKKSTTVIWFSLRKFDEGSVVKQNSYLLLKEVHSTHKVSHVSNSFKDLILIHGQWGLMEINGSMSKIKVF